MAFLAIQFLTGLASASSLFLMASGLTVIFGVTRVVNFAHGSLTMLGAYVGWSILTRLPHGAGWFAPGWFAIGVIAAAGVVGLIGAAAEATVMRRVYRAPELFQLLATFGLLLIAQDATLWLWGPNDLSLPRAPWLRGFIPIAGERFPTYDLVLIAIGPLVLLLLHLGLHRTRWGTLVRAATQDRTMLAALGVDQRLVFTAVFALGSMLAGLGGALLLPDQTANLQMDLTSVTDAFVVVVLGGLGSLTGAYLASVLIGVLHAFGIVLLPKATLVLVFLVMVAVLMVRPHGLLGRPEAAPPGSQMAGSRMAETVRPAPGILVVLGMVALAAAIGAPFVAGPYALSILTEAMTAILFAASLHFMMGPGGMPSFGHAAWFGIGAYGAGLAAQGLGAPMLLGLAIALLVAAATAAAFGGFVARLSGVYLAMLTLAFAQIVWALAFQWVSVTGGDNGILGLRPAAWAAFPAGFYWLALGLCLGGTLLLRRVLYAPFGYALRATRDSVRRADAIGLDRNRLRIVAFAIAGGAAGLSGGVFAYAKGGVFPTYVSIGRSVDALVMVLLGGVQTMAGPIVGAISYTALYDWLLIATPYWRAVLGAAIILLVVAFPDGIAGSAQRLWRRRDGAA